MTQKFPFLYPYTVKRSPRARYVRLSVSTKGLIVTVPQRFCVSRDLPPILEEKKDWIAEALKKVAQRSRLRESSAGLPEIIELRALEEKWRIRFAPLPRERLKAEEGTITLASDFNEDEALVALRHWVHLKGCSHLPSMLNHVAERHRFSYINVSVREQKSRWGSCSFKGNISLNSRLLFLPPYLVRHILLHELCHLKEMNHSKAFHNLLAQLDPDAGKNAAELKQAWNFVPGWVL